MHASPLLRAPDGKRNAICCCVATVPGEGAGAVRQGSVQEVAQGAGVVRIEKSGEVANERIKREAAVRPGQQSVRW